MSQLIRENNISRKAAIIDTNLGDFFIMTMTFKELSETEYEKFAAIHPQANFLQASASGKRRTLDGWRLHLVGVIKNDKIIAAAMLSSRKSLFGYCDFECQHGPLADYDNVEVTEFLLRNIISYVKANRGLGVRINPNLPLNHRDEEGIIVADGYDGHKYIDLIVKSGFSKIDDKLVDNDPNLLRWHYKKDMVGIHNDQDLFQKVSLKTRQNLQRTERMGVKVETISSKDLDIFLKIMESTGTRRNFSWRDQNYFASLLDYFGPERAMCVIAKLDTTEYLKNINDSISQNNLELESIRAKHPDSAKTISQIAIHEKQISDLNQKIKEVNEMIAKHGVEPIAMAGSIFIAYGHEIVYLSSGAFKEYSKFCAPYAVQLYAMRYAIKHNIPIYNFYGTKGSFCGHPDMDGVFNFKKGFCGYLEEEIGYFYKDVRPLVMIIRGLLRKIRTII